MAKDFVKDGKLDRVAAAAALRSFLQTILTAARFNLTVNVTSTEPASAPGQAEVVAEFDGPDKEILLARGGEVLKALEQLACRALDLDPSFNEKILLDCGGYRAMRFEELRLTARVAAERVQSSRQEFRLNPMSSRERRIVHLTLKEIPGIRTESAGTGEERQVIIYPVKTDSPSHQS